ncbi:putative uncharacterized protein DDB_G0286901 [Melanaphis sacchari]|uniref:Golgi-associated plant pathogenesis-related protein 1 n=1 Tax=Melanaphis sacchari TaxID=742174 RepID=A0A2H8TI44_9HEMI|nr:putative uncharacterized protein DDB_G0286901 [Melanaphis sacchari]
MVKPIYCNVLLLVSCLVYEAHGNNPRVRYIKTPSRFISDNNDPYDSSSLSTAAADVAVEDTESLESAAKLPASHSLRKSLSSNASSGYDGNRGLGSNNKSRRGVHYKRKPYDMVSNNQNSEQMQNNMNSGFSNDKSLSDLDNTNYQTEMTLDDSNIKKRNNDMTFESLNKRPLSGLNNRNKKNENTSENKNIRERQNSIISDSTQTKMNLLDRIKENLRQNPLFPKLNEDDSQRINYGNEKSSVTNMMNFNKNLFNDRGVLGQNINLSFRKCCINGNCRVLKDGEKCGVEDLFTNMKDTQQLKNPMFVTMGNGDNGFQDMMSNLKPFKVNSFNKFGDSFDEGSNIQETRKPTNMRFGLMRYPITIPSLDSSSGIGNGMSSFVMPQKNKPKNYPYSEPIGLSEDEANEIRNKVLQKSNLYRKKHNLIPFTLDDQINNCAQDWANNLAKLQTLQHRQNNAYGENLYADQDLNNLGEKAVDAWYNEITKFNIDDEESGLGSNSGTHHMTQLLWKPSTKLGVGVSQNPNGMYNVVANYDPRGNILGYFKDNLPEIKQEDIEEAKKSKRATESVPATRWFSSSSSPFQSRWNNYEPY